MNMKLRAMVSINVLAPEPMFSTMLLRNSLRLFGSLKQSSQTRIAETTNLLENVCVSLRSHSLWDHFRKLARSVWKGITGWLGM